MSPASQVDAWLQRLASERQASVHTVDAYRRDLAKLLRFMESQGVATFDALDPNRMRAFIAAEHREQNL
ncbi:MAG TPA: site-specific integrase, partial [Rhodanobacter sp.]|nr:site-specific integrase [Rhodanobacter sp.]